MRLMHTDISFIIPKNIEEGNPTEFVHELSTLSQVKIDQELDWEWK